MNHIRPANENAQKPLIESVQRCRRGMNTALVKSVEENVNSLGTVCHVVETKGNYALVHASPNGLAQIIGQLGFTVSPAKRGGDYYAVKIGAVRASAPVVRSVPQAPALASRVVSMAPAARAPKMGTPFEMVIKGESYVCTETQPKRRQDTRRWVIRKEGDGKERVVTFQDHDGHTGQCGCEDWIYRRNQRPDPDCKHIKAFKSVFARKATVANNGQRHEYVQRAPWTAFSWHRN